MVQFSESGAVLAGEADAAPFQVQGAWFLGRQKRSPGMSGGGLRIAFHHHGWFCNCCSFWHMTRSSTFIYHIYLFNETVETVRP